MLAQLRDPELRKKLLKKRTPPSNSSSSSSSSLEPRVRRELSEEEKKLQIEAERNDLFIELLGYMEAPHGNLEELTDKVKSSTGTSRGFIFTLIRRGWIVGYRVSDGLPDGGDREKVLVFPGREVCGCDYYFFVIGWLSVFLKQDFLFPIYAFFKWTNGIKLSDFSESDLKNKFEEGGEVARVHLYRFDEKAKVHVLDEIGRMNVDKRLYNLAYPVLFKKFYSKIESFQSARHHSQKMSPRKTRLKIVEIGKRGICGFLNTNNLTFLR